MQLYRHSHLPQQGRLGLVAKNTPILVVGDSNIANITKVNNLDVSLECFPGGNFYNIGQMFEKAYNNNFNMSSIKHVILSVCINSQDNKSSTAQDM